MKNNSSGILSILGILGLAGGIILFLALRAVFPALAMVLLFAAGVAIALLVIFVLVVLYFAFKKPKTGLASTEEERNREILSKGKKNLMQLRRLSMEIKHSEIRTFSTEVCSSIDRIMKVLQKQPDNISSMRQFFNYYLPTLEKILKKYAMLENSGVPTEEITQNTIECLGDIQTVMEKQYQSLFDHDILDLTVEMEVLTQMCKRDGLLSEEDFNQTEEKA